MISLIFSAKSRFDFPTAFRATKDGWNVGVGVDVDVADDASEFLVPLPQSFLESGQPKLVHRSNYDFKSNEFRLKRVNVTV